MSGKTLSRRMLLAWLGGLGAPALALEPLLAKNAPAGVDPVPYLVSEKLDGVRALWDGQALRFRSGRAVTAPGWFLAAYCPRPRWTASCGWDGGALTSCLAP